MLGKSLARLLVFATFGLLTTTARSQTAPVTVFPTSVAFGNVALGFSLSKTVTLTNNQNVPLSISPPNISGSAEFAVIPGGNCGNTLGAGKSCAYHVGFTPTGLGLQSATLVINDNASNSPQQVTLNGNGSPAATVNPSSLSFSSQLITTTSTPKTVTLANNQGVSLSLLSPGISSNFSVVGGTCGSNLSAFSKCTYLVTFTPPALGRFGGSLTINLGGSNPALIVSSTGIGGTTGIQSVGIDPLTVSILSGTTQQLTATAIVNDGTTIAVTAIARWSSSNSRVATVNTTGLVSTATGGSAVIKASLGNTLSGSANLTSLPLLVSIAVTPQNLSLPLGKSQQFVATGSNNDGSKQNLTSIVAWSSSATAIASIGGGGLATASAQGSTIIGASLGNVVGSTTLKVAPPVVVSIGVTPTNFLLPTGATQQFTATGIYSDSSSRLLTSSSTWVSSNLAVASIASGGIATGAAPGNTTISANIGLVSGSAALVVSLPVLQSIAVTPLNIAVSAGSSQQFAATGFYSDGTTVDLTSIATWVSSDSAAATIDPNGLASGITAGWTTLTANSQGIGGSSVLAVTQPGTTLQSITLTPSPSSLNAGASQQFAATGNFSDGSTRDLTSAALWYANQINARYPTDPSFAQYGVPSPLVTGVLVELGWNMVDMGPGATGGQYQWSSFDATYVTPYTSAGKRVDLAIWAQNYPGLPSMVPSYVQAYSTNTVPACTNSAPWIAPPYSPDFLAAYKSFLAEVIQHYAGNPAIGYSRVGLSAGAEIYRFCGPVLDAYPAPFPYSDPPFNCSTASNVGQCVWLAFDQDMLNYVQSLSPTFAILGPSTSQDQGGNDPNNVYPSSEDDQAVADGFGFGNQGLQKSDLTNYVSGLPCNANWCAKFDQYTGQVPLELQTAVQSDPTCTAVESACTNISGSLIDVLPFADARHTSIFEIYEGDLYVALNPSHPSYKTYGTQYSTALQNALQSNPIASISASGIATGVAPGSTIIYAQYGAITGSAVLNVTSAGPQRQ